MKEFIIDGKKFRTSNAFYKLAQDIFTFNLTNKATNNLDVINDYIHGGFGQHDYLEEIKVIWINMEISRRNLTIDLYYSILKMFEEAENVTLEKFKKTKA